MAGASNINEDVRKKLKQLRDNPAGTQDAPDTVLQLVYNFLSEQAPSADHPVHWFCSRANNLTVDAATFLIRLHAYNGPRVEAWRALLVRCLAGCAACVQGFQRAKIQSRHTFFGAFTDAVLQNFYSNLGTWELERVLEGLSKAHIPPSYIDSPKCTLSEAPPAIVYHMLSNPLILRDSRIINILRSYTPTGPINDWPTDAPPLGLLLLLMEETPQVRRWAQQQVVTYKTTPMTFEQFIEPYADAVKAATMAIDTPAEGAHPTFPFFAKDPSVLWSGYSAFLRFVPRPWFAPSVLYTLDLRRIVIGHLSDTGNHFGEVLKAFVLMLSRIGPKMWEKEEPEPEYPVVVLHSVKDNPRFLEMLQAAQTSGREHWTLSWLQTYLKSLDNLPAFEKVLPIVLQFLCEELQRERFEEVRPAAMYTASKLLSAVLVQSPPETGGKVLEHSAAWESVDIHADALVSVAFGKLYTGDAWTEARKTVRKLVRNLLLRDIRNVCSTITQLAVPSKQSAPVQFPGIREQMWRKLYETIHPSDSDGLATILAILSQISHIDDLQEAAFAEAIKKSQNAEHSQAVLKRINGALGVFRSGFADAVSRFLDFSNSTAVLELLLQPNLVRNLISLMFSPVDGIREPAQAVTGLALDVESRQDCFRALLGNYPEAAFGGMFDFLETFVKYASTVPEACSVSKALALCLTDIIEVICSKTDGLLRQEQFLTAIGGGGPSVELPKWWRLMTKALSIIFLRTPRWALYFENEVMAIWMRDALIFGRDMLDKWKDIEAGALAKAAQASSGNRRLSHIGKQMVDDLQPVLLELARWLRLTDEELLHQSFALLQALLACFRETGVRPSDMALTKLQKHVDDGRKSDPTRPQTRLDSARLARLQDAISAFDEREDEDEIQIISHKLPDKKVRPKITPEPEAKIAKIGKSSFSQRGITPATQKQLTARAVPGKASKATYFSAGDQKKLESASTLPRFSKSAHKQTVTTTAQVDSAKLPDVHGKKGETSSEASAAESAASSDESEGEEAGGEGTLAALAKLQRTPVIKKPVERRQVKMLDMPTAVKNPALERLQQREDARRTGMRLKPDVSSLHRTVLSWSYDYDGPVPPGTESSLARVPDKFADAQHYRRIFEPLLLLECWAQIQQSKDEPQDAYQCRIVNRQFTDDWVDMDITIMEVMRKDWYLSDTDVVVLRHPESKKSYLGKATQYKVLPHLTQASVRFMLVNNDPGPQVNTVWQLSKVFSLTTVHREYAALMGLPYYDLYDTVMQPMLSRPIVPEAKDLRETMTTYNLNEPQAKAVLSSMKTNGFSLIQGPPGTGKTSTICGLVQAFLTNRPKPATAVYVGRNATAGDREPPKKILLCAPSNAAIDEITYRLKEGVSGAGRRNMSPKVVRVGAPKGINLSVKDVSLDDLAEQKLNANPAVQNSTKDAGNELALVRSELQSVKNRRQQMLEEITNIQDNAAKQLALEEEVKALNKRKVALTQQFDRLKDKQKSDSRTFDAASRKARLEVLQESDIICTTLSGAGHDILESFDFEMVIIDEAAQAIELSSLIPLKYRCSRCIMVGDPQQLPPTVISQEASKYLYNQSLFVRLQRHRPEAVHLLSIQYRMHPDISRLPSQLFYGGRLINGPDMASKTQKPWHTHPKFGTYRFFNVSRGQEERGPARSILNRAECQVAVALFNRLRQEYSAYDFDLKVGVVSMYRAQVIELRRAFEARFGPNIMGLVDFHTVDGFQGQEKDIIILSCVRAGPGLQNVGFLSDVRRMNVALTRAKSSVFILGHAPTLERSDQTWRDIVTDAKTRSCLVDTDVTYFTSAATGPKVIPKPARIPSQTEEMITAPTLLTPRELAAATVAPKQDMSKPQSEEGKTKKTSEAPKPEVPQDVLIADSPMGDTVAPAAVPQANGAEKPKVKNPVRRAKQGPTLFIPQKKRPLPSESEAGPSNVRRRL